MPRFPLRDCGQQRRVAMVRGAGVLLLFDSLLFLFLAPPFSEAESEDDSTLYATGDWGGARPMLAGKGVVIDLQYTGTYQGLVAGAGRASSDYGGKVDLFASLDSEKLGLWRGGALRTHVEYRHGDAPSNLGGTLFATNTAQLWPVDAPETIVATSLFLTQKLGSRADVLIGKVNPIDLLAADVFFGGWGIHRFMNLIFVAPPSGLIPAVFMGSVLSYKVENRAYTLMIFDPEDRTEDYFPGDLFSEGVNMSASASWQGEFHSRDVRCTVTALYSTADGVDYSTLPPGTQTTSKSGAYNVSLQISHDLGWAYQSEGDWSVHFKIATADGNPNYVNASVIAGITGRPQLLSADRLGLGAFYYDLSDELENTLDRQGFEDESAIELYYNWSPRPWLTLGGDVQYVDQARRDLDGSLIIAFRANIEL